MEDLIKELERIAADNEKRAKEYEENNSYVASANAKGVAYGLNFATSLFKLKLKAEGLK